KRVARQNQFSMRISAIAVCEDSIAIQIARREGVIVGETRAIGVDGEHRALAQIAIIRPIQSVARYNQTGRRISSAAAAAETVQGGKTQASSVDGEHRALARTAASIRRPKQSVAR